MPSLCTLPYQSDAASTSPPCAAGRWGFLISSHHTPLPLPNLHLLPYLAACLQNTIFPELPFPSACNPACQSSEQAAAQLTTGCFYSYFPSIPNEYKHPHSDCLSHIAFYLHTFAGSLLIRSKSRGASFLVLFLSPLSIFSSMHSRNLMQDCV